jgi:hypothetical protein
MNPIAILLLWGGAFVLASTARNVRPSLHRFHFMILVLMMLGLEIAALVVLAMARTSAG